MNKSLFYNIALLFVMLFDEVVIKLQVPSLNLMRKHVTGRAITKLWFASGNQISKRLVKS